MGFHRPISAIENYRITRAKRLTDASRIIRPLEYHLIAFARCTQTFGGRGTITVRRTIIFSCSIRRVRCCNTVREYLMEPCRAQRYCGGGQGSVFVIYEYKIKRYHDDGDELLYTKRVSA